MKKRISFSVLSVALLLCFAFFPITAYTQEGLSGAAALDLLAEAVDVEVFDAPGAEPSFEYDSAHYNLTVERKDETLSVKISKKNRSYLRGETVKVYLPMGDYSSVNVKADASTVTLPPFNADFKGTAGASTMVCYLPEDFAHDINFTAEVSDVTMYLHRALQDFVITVKGEVSDISLPDGVVSGVAVGEGTHNFQISANTSNVDISWYDGSMDSE